MNHHFIAASTKGHRLGVHQLMQLLTERFTLRSRIVEFQSAAAILFLLGFAMAERF